MTLLPLIGSSPFGAADLRGVLRHTVPRAAELFRQGSLLSQVLFIESGGVKLTRMDRDGHESIIELAFAGAWLGTAAVIARIPAPVTAVTYERTVVTQLAADVFRDLLQHDPALSHRIHQFHASELCRQVGWMNQLSASSSRQRLQHVIHELVAARNGDKVAGAIRLHLPLKHWELAGLIAVTPEHLSRMLHVMEKEGVIARRNGWIVIPSLKRLCPDVGAEGAPWSNPSPHVPVQGMWPERPVREFARREIS